MEHHPRRLTEAEIALVSAFRRLSAEQQGQLVRAVTGLADRGGRPAVWLRTGAALAQGRASLRCSMGDAA